MLRFSIVKVYLAKNVWTCLNNKIMTYTTDAKTGVVNAGVEFLMPKILQFQKKHNCTILVVITSGLVTILNNQRMLLEEFFVTEQPIQDINLWVFCDGIVAIAKI